MQNKIKRKGGHEFLGLKEKLVRTQDSLREIKRQVFLSGEGSVLLRFSKFMLVSAQSLLYKLVLKMGFIYVTDLICTYLVLSLKIRGNATIKMQKKVKWKLAAKLLRTHMLTLSFQI